MNKALIQTYTGSGKGKTTSSAGLAFRAIGKNWTILIVQFLKGQDCYDYGEINTYRKFEDQLTVIQSGKKKIVVEHNKDKEDEVLAKNTWELFTKELSTGKKYILDNVQSYKPYDMLILDEILPTLNLGLITQKQFFEFISHCRLNRPNLEIVLTGRMWSEALFDKIKDISDLVSDIRCCKHYFNKTCVKCKRSFEFRSNYCPNCGNELVTTPIRDGIEF